jgi:hypothetical protein
MSGYQKPRIQTLDATELLELMGPAQGLASGGIADGSGGSDMTALRYTPISNVRPTRID